MNFAFECFVHVELVELDVQPVELRKFVLLIKFKWLSLELEWLNQGDSCFDQVGSIELNLQPIEDGSLVLVLVLDRLN